MGENQGLGATGAFGRERGREKQGICRSRGGYTTKIHAVVDALGNPIKIYLAGGQISDYTPDLRV